MTKKRENIITMGKLLYYLGMSVKGYMEELDKNNANIEQLEAYLTSICDIEFAVRKHYYEVMLKDFKISKEEFIKATILKQKE